MRQAGFGFIRDRQTGSESYVRRLGARHYPRLHMYVDEAEGQVTFNLHLDQKENSYEGAHRHNAEYDGSVVEGEIARLRSLIGVEAQTSSVAGNVASSADPLLGMKPGELPETIKSKKKWWKFW